MRNFLRWSAMTMVSILLFADSARTAENQNLVVGVPGGLGVQLGAKDLEMVNELADSGRFLINVLAEDGEAVEAARVELRSKGLYGLASVEQMTSLDKLPYAENLVNLVIVAESPGAGLPLKEIQRVLCPNGVVLLAAGMSTAEQLQAAGFAQIHTVKTSRDWLAGSKPWPTEMDVWSHPRHSASGNAVSQDTIVGPPRRVRWLAGPWQEVANMVTADGRNYYGGLITRDSFNGLRLWEKSLSPSPSVGGYGYRPLPGSALPVAGDGLVFVYSEGKLQAVDGGTGSPVREYPDAGKPHTLLYDEGTLIVVGEDGLRAFHAGDASALWKYDAKRPQSVIAGDDLVAFVQKGPESGAKDANGKEIVTNDIIVVLEKRTGKLRWQRDDCAWASHATRCVYYSGMLTFEISTLNNDGAGNSIHILVAADGSTQLDHDFLPGMNHMRQARAMFVNNQLWLLRGGSDANNKRQPTEVAAIDYLTGKTQAAYPAGLAHCFPPVATTNYLFTGEMDLTDLRSGQIDANQITKAACGRANGWVPANGLIYTAPKHCVCWPMLRGYSALAAARPDGNPALADIEEMDFLIEKGVAAEPADAAEPAADDWPMYRHDAWRSGSTTGAGPAQLDVLWSVELSKPNAALGPIEQDWAENPFVKGPVTPPVVADGLAIIARPDAHEVVALDAATGAARWRFTANGRVDTPPTIHRGLCLFGTKTGFVYCLRASDGQMVWRMRAAPLDERIVTYGGVESPWPVPGSVLVFDDVAYFAAGRQSLADGGILVFAVDPASGERLWVSRLDSIPQKGFYESSGLEFDNFDLLFRQGDNVAMSRWVFDRQSGAMQVNRWEAFARLNTGKGSVMAPQGYWSYSPRNQQRTKTFAPRRPLVVFRDNVLLGCQESKQAIYRRDFDLENGEEFESKWITGWAGSQGSQKPDGLAWRSQRLSAKATWTAEIFEAQPTSARAPDERTIDALAMAGERLYVAGSDGALSIVSTADGKTMASQKIPTPLWDGLAIGNGRLYVATRDGNLMCLGEK